MLSLILAAAMTPPSTTALARCRPVLARKAGGDIDLIALASVRRSGQSTTIRGTLTAFIGMGAPAPGMASAHHLIRASYIYSCTIRSGRVRKAAVSPVN